MLITNYDQQITAMITAAMQKAKATPTRLKSIERLTKSELIERYNFTEYQALRHVLHASNKVGLSA